MKHSTNANLTSVPTNDLAVCLEPLWRRMDAMGAKTAEGESILNSIAEDVGRSLGVEPESIPRRVYGIRELQTLATEADLLLDAAIESSIRLEELPVFPMNHATARDLVDIHYGSDPELNQRRLATSLFHFCQGYLEGSAEDKQLEYLHAEKLKRRVRNTRFRERRREQRKLVAA